MAVLDWRCSKISRQIICPPGYVLAYRPMGQTLSTSFQCTGSPRPLLQGAALSSNVIKFSLDPSAPGSGPVSTSVVIRQPWLDVTGWALPQLPPLITDILLSLDDKYIIFSNWLQGEGARGGGGSYCLLSHPTLAPPLPKEGMRVGGAERRGVRSGRVEPYLFEGLMGGDGWLWCGVVGIWDVGGRERRSDEMLASLVSAAAAPYQ